MNRTDRLRLDALAATGVAAHRLRTAETDIETAVARGMQMPKLKTALR